ncbi:MAG: fused MFS/spermidine synthase [Planctomycetes bacterium]|nr:fused MFS/spermidine synthase [Planctomycetota bacterium]
MIRYAFTIFVSAFLLFQVQPLIGRFILPWFGGSASVWSVAMLFFQGALLAGYGYAHFSIARLKPRAQAGLHLVLLLACMLTLPIIPPESLKPDGPGMPTLRILLLLTVSVGLPYFALASTGPLLQAWFSRSYPKKSPYALYALSNVGSLLALLSYPFLFEPVWGRVDLAWNWSYLFIVFSVLCIVVAVSAFLRTRRTEQNSEVPVAPPGPTEAPAELEDSIAHRPIYWIAFAAAGCTLLLAFTNQMCMDVASVPLLWVLPLSIYLLSFVITFAGERWYPRRLCLLLLPLAALGAATAPGLEPYVSLRWVIAVFMASLLVFCVVCHGEAFRLRPPASQLTKFYLLISVGGVLGGLFVAVVAPLVFSLYNELPAGMLATGALILVALARDPKSKLYGGRPRWAWTALLLVAVAAVASFAYSVYYSLEDTISVSRSFYGVYRVKETPEGSEFPWQRVLYSGSTIHGRQFMGKGSQGIPTSYYGMNSGVGLVLTSFPEDKPLKVGIVGLGAGTLALYSKPQDHFKFYEIDAHVLDLAHEYFKLLEDAPGNIEVVIGDARLQLEREEPQQFDVLVLDAFSSDAIPIHLLTIEAFELYRRHVKPGGVICVHTSNRYLNLQPVVVSAAREIHLDQLIWLSGINISTGTTMAEWMILTSNETVKAAFQRRAEDFYHHEQEIGALDDWSPYIGRVLEVEDVDEDFHIWTDDYSNLFSIVR